MYIFKSFLIAISTYSRIPVPQKLIEWDEKNMRYSICFFPFIGVVLGLVLILWYHIAELLEFNNIIFAAIATVLPVFVTGGIHMDGYCDTIDALSSYQPAERKLEILKDPNAGAFAVIKACIYYILYFAMMTQISYNGIIIVSIGFVISRSLSGLAVINFKSAKGSGLATMFKKAAHKNIATVVLLFIFTTCVTGLVIFFDIYLASAAVICACIVFLYYRYIAYKKFGGITGDIAGYFLVMCELWIVIGIVFMEGLIRVWN